MGRRARARRGRTRVDRTPDPQRDRRAPRKRWRCGRRRCRRTRQAPPTNSTRIAEVAYREGEVGILELLDAVRTASRARTAQHRLAARGAPGADRPGTRSGRRPVALKHLCRDRCSHALLVAAACSRAAPPAADAGRTGGARASRDGPTRRNCSRSIPPLVVGETSRFAIHLTRLDSFKAADRGHGRSPPARRQRARRGLPRRRARRVRAFSAST